jgi:methanogenic corrinoid protein MtbC1
MVYIRTKTVKGEKYLYLVKSVWDSKRNTSKQETIKYLGKASETTKDDIPPEYRNDKKIISYLSSVDGFSIEKKEELLTKLKDQLYRYLIKGDFDSTKQLYDTYSSTSGIASFFEKILTPVMYKIGDMWASNQLGIADEHVASNIANTLVKMVSSKYTVMPSKRKIVICVPEGEEHSLGANILETHLSSIGHRVYNLAPSEPHDSIVSFIRSTKPDSVMVSITLEDNIKPGQRLVKKILDHFDVRVYIGGQALKNDKVKFENAQIIRENSLRNIAKIISSKK